MHRKNTTGWRRKLRGSLDRYRTVAQRRGADIRSGILQVGGLSAFIVAAAEWSTIAGWAVAGVSCFVMELLTRSGVRR